VTVFLAMVGAVVIFLLAIIAAAVTAPLAALDSTSNWVLLNRLADWAIVIGPIGSILLGVFVSQGHEL
jgi:predicted benzoate:H+ symporter BenE